MLHSIIWTMNMSGLPAKPHAWCSSWLEWCCGWMNGWTYDVAVFASLQVSCCPFFYTKLHGNSLHFSELRLLSFNASCHASASWTPHAFSFYAFKNDQSEALSYTKGGAFPNFHFLLYSAFEKLPCEISVDATIWN